MTFFLPGFRSMCFVLFTGIEGYDIESAGISLNKKGAKKYNVFVCPEIKALHFDSELGADDVNNTKHTDLNPGKKNVNLLTA